MDGILFAFFGQAIQCLSSCELDCLFLFFVVVVGLFGISYSICRQRHVGRLKALLGVDMCGQATRCDAMQYNSMTEVEAEVEKMVEDKKTVQGLGVEI